MSSLLKVQHPRAVHVLPNQLLHTLNKFLSDCKFVYLVTEPTCTEVALAWGKYCNGQIWTWPSHWKLLSLWHAPESFRLRCPGASWHLFQSRPSPYFPFCSNACPPLSLTLWMSDAVLCTGHCVTHAVISQNAAAKDREKEVILTGEELQKSFQ